MRQLILLAIALPLSLSVLSGCAPRAQDGEPPAAVVAVVNKNCVGCHPGDRALAFKAPNAAEAEKLIATMEARGARISAEDKAVLVEYFVRE